MKLTGKLFKLWLSFLLYLPLFVRLGLSILHFENNPVVSPLEEPNIADAMLMNLKIVGFSIFVFVKSQWAFERV